MSSNIQIQEIHNWLKTIYQNENIPTFEINNRTLNILSSIMIRCQEKEKHSQIIMNYLKNSAAEYNIAAEKLSKILQQVKINLHTQLHSDISGLALVASVLKLKNTSLSSFIHEMERIFEETSKISETHKDESKISGKLSSDSIAMQQKLQQLERELQEAEEWWKENLPEIHNNKKYSSFLKSKVKEYDKELNHLEKYLQKMQIDPNIYHSTLVKKSEISITVDKRNEGKIEYRSDETAMHGQSSSKRRLGKSKNCRSRNGTGKTRERILIKSGKHHPKIASHHLN
ncbi:HAUS augmin-like complex subunit 1 isoform X1 [Centruroides vittatus]|uniref:HAUS augmin-like complex subunit 1 isoform X1 n=1 Tax=Centruroides vittatus TaxID=120091 RepID=UPI00351010A2